MRPFRAVATLTSFGSYALWNTSRSYSAATYKPPQPLSLANKVVLITGASAGIGSATAWAFAALDSRLVLLGRRKDRLEQLKRDINELYPTVLIHTVAISVTDYEAVAALPNSLPRDFQDITVLVNNAGLALGVSSVDKNAVSQAKTVLDTNVLGTVAMCSAFLPGMLARNEGHVINIGSVAGHHAYATGSIYNASKFAVHGFTSAARHDLQGTPIRVTTISPGLVQGTEFSNVRLQDDSKAALVYSNIEALRPEDVADNVIYAATRPAHVQISDIVMYATNQSGPRDLSRVGPSLGAK